MTFVKEKELEISSAFENQLVC